MALLILVFLIAAVFFGLGFAVQWLFLVAAVLAALWLFGFFAHPPEGRWYRW